MRIVLIGPQGSGKGTQGIRLCERYGVPHVATGDLLRTAVKEDSELGRRAKSYMERGELVPDDLVIDMLRERFSRPDAAAGFILDGFPRNAAQAQALDATLSDLGQRLDAVVSLEVPEDVLVTRMASRWNCPVCGRTYSRGTDDPGTCDRDGTPLVQRDDDKPEAIRRRLDIFTSQTSPLLAHYERAQLLVRVDGVGDIDEVEKRVIEALESR